MTTPTDMEAGFWKRIYEEPNTGCWLWSGASDRGYGRLRVNGRVYKAHRVAWMVCRGEIPSGTHVCHHCDNPPCCNPDHLFLGSDADNVADKIRKGRMRRGVDMPGAKLDPDKVREIRGRTAAGETQNAIARALGVSPAAISHVLDGRNWKHVI